MNQHPKGDIFHDWEYPDQTEKIMSRLGYERVSPAQAKWQRVMVWLRRAGATTALACFLSLGLHIYCHDASEGIETHTRPIPDALEQDLGQQRDRFRNFMQSINELQIQPLPESQPQPVDEPQQPGFEIRTLGPYLQV